MYSQGEFLYARICNLKMTQKCTRGRKKCVLTSKTICFDKFVISIFSRRCISQNCIEGEEVALSLSLQVLHVFPKAQCSRNFQNVKLRLDFIEIWLFYRHSDFTWNPILANANGPKMSFWQFQRFWTLTFGKFRTWKLLKFTKNQI